ncbi:hypothetical protein SO694_0000753 [Aureococcus anophagefferens]|uniref:Uncharacterized protein n=1 Tax=Aureococcus anophagefferens TaxID=44056 RepID=A0ABR1GB12_AURAN
MPPPPPDRDLKELIEAKERELADLGDYRLAQLEAGVRDRDRQLDLAAQRLDKLKEDFSYNLSLIAERDAELATLEEERGQLRDAVRDRDDRLEELRGEVADREKALEGGNESAAQREAYWQSKLGELRSEGDALRWEAKESARAAKEGEAALRLEYASKLRDAAEDAERSRRDLQQALEDGGRRRDAEVQVQTEKHDSLVRAADQRADAAAKRCARALELKGEAERAAEASASRCRELEQQLQRERWERDDDGRRSAAREKELEERFEALRCGAARADADARDRLMELSARSEKAEAAARDASAARDADGLAATKALETALAARDAEASRVRDESVKHAVALEQKKLGRAHFEDLERRREAYDNSLDLALEDARSAARLEHEAVLRDHARELEALRGRLEGAEARGAALAEDLDALTRRKRDDDAAANLRFDEAAKDAAARYRDLERRHETDVARAKDEIPEDAQDAFLRSELELKAELSRARTKQDVEDRARVAERDLALATSLLKTRDAELEEAGRARHAGARRAGPRRRGPPAAGPRARRGRRRTVRRRRPAGARVAARSTPSGAGAPSSPLFSDDAGGASPFLQGLGSVESRFSGGGGGASSATEARQREIIAAMRGDLEQIRTTRRARALRDEEVAVLKERERQNDAARKDAAIAVARRVESLERDIGKRDRDLKQVHGEARSRSPREAQGPAPRGGRVAPGGISDDKARQLALAVRKLTQRNAELQSELAPLARAEPRGGRRRRTTTTTTPRRVEARQAEDPHYNDRD